jgi:hypothetical protein
VEPQSAYTSSQKLQSHKDIRVECTGKNPTKFGRIPLLRKFLIGFGVKEELESAVPIEKWESEAPPPQVGASLKTP